jgi:hypothetical protein
VTAAANTWSYNSGERQSLPDKSKHLMQLSSRVMADLEALATFPHSPKGRNLESARASAALGWAEITCLLSSSELDSLKTHKADLEGGLVGLTHNASNACHHQSNLAVLLGYLSRRYSYKGNECFVAADLYFADYFLKNLYITFLSLNHFLTHSPRKSFDDWFHFCGSSEYFKIGG